MISEYAQKFDKYMTECEVIESVKKTPMGAGSYICNILDLSMCNIPETNKKFLYVQLKVLDAIGECYNFKGEKVFVYWDLTLENYKDIKQMIKGIDIPIFKPSAILRYEHKASAFEDILVYVEKRDKTTITKIPGTVRYHFYEEKEDVILPF